MPDPWLNEDGTLHPAAAWGGLLEWEEVIHRTVRHRRCTWSEARGWEVGAVESGIQMHRIAPFVAAALLEKHLREKLWAKARIALCPETYSGVLGWHVFKYGPNGMAQWLGEDGKWYLKSDAKMDVPRFWNTNYTAAIQGACRAAKREDDGESTDE